MEPNILSIIIGAVALIIGILLGKFIFAKNTKKQLDDAEQQAQKIIADGQLQAENLKKEKLLEAKEKFVQLKSDHDREVLQRTQKTNEAENRIKQKGTIDQSKRAES
jgi:ribonuclease Y